MFAGSANLKENEAVTPKRSNILEIPYDLNSMDDANSKPGTETMQNYEENGYMQSSNLVNFFIFFSLEVPVKLFLTK